MGEWRDLYRSLVWKPEGKRLFGRHRHRWKNNIKMGIWIGSSLLRIRTGGGFL
jgi:hypothetical protein